MITIAMWIVCGAIIVTALLLYSLLFISMNYRINRMYDELVKNKKDEDTTLL